MIRGGFLSDAERQALTAMARDGLAEHRIARRANAIVLLDKGWSCARVAGALLLDDDTVRGWFQAYETGSCDGKGKTMGARLINNPRRTKIGHVEAFPVLHMRSLRKSAMFGE